jgi:hypothetical protein
METIQLEVSPELAQRLRRYPDKLAQILEWGLNTIEAEERPGAKNVSPERQKILDALRATGLVLELDRTLVARYQAGPDKSRRTPVYVKGKPLSEVIVAERGSAWGDEV